VQREAKQSFACVDEVTIYWSFTSTSFAFEWCAGIKITRRFGRICTDPLYSVRLADLGFLFALLGVTLSCGVHTRCLGTRLCSALASRWKALTSPNHCILQHERFALLRGKFRSCGLREWRSERVQWCGVHCRKITGESDTKTGRVRPSQLWIHVPYDLSRGFYFHFGSC
jgi:hypothetical protein